MNLLTLLLLPLTLTNALQVPLSIPPPISDTTLISPSTKTYISNLLSHWNSSGLSLAVVHQDPNNTDNPWHTEFASFGISTSDKKATDEHTLFAIASNSKLFLAISVGLLIHNETLQAEREKSGLKRLEWRSKIGEVLGEEWGLMDEEMSRGVTIQDMLSHRTGMPRHDFSGAVREGGVVEMIETMRSLRPSATHRETFQYNNLMYETLSHLPPHLLGIPFESYIAQNIFSKLNMSSSTYSIAQAEEWDQDERRKETFAHGFQYHGMNVVEGRRGVLKATVPYFSRPGEEGIWAGAGGVLTTANDLTIWAATLLNRGRHPITNESVIPSEVLDYVERGISVAEGKPSYPELSPKVYGSGLFRYTYQGHEVLEHGGSNPGFKTQLLRIPSANLAVISLSNDENGNGLMESAKWRLVDEILGLEKVDWSKRYEEKYNKFLDEVKDVTPRPEGASLPKQPIESLEGKRFGHMAYGVLRPCVVPSSLGSLSSSPSPSSLDNFDTYSSNDNDKDTTCAALLRTPTVTQILTQSNLSIPTLIIPWKRFFATHLRLTHFEGDVFNVSVVWGNAEVRREEGYFSPCTPASTQKGGEEFNVHGGNGEKEVDWDDKEDDEGALTYIAEESFEAEWVHSPEEGFAFRGGIWGKEGEDAREPEARSGKESAEVWFGVV